MHVLKSMLIIFFCLSLLSNSAIAQEVDEGESCLLPYQLGFDYPKDKDIVQPPIEVEYKGKKGVALFLKGKMCDSLKKNSIRVYFLTDNNKELNLAYEMSAIEYDNLITAFVFTEKKTGKKSIVILTSDNIGDSMHSYSYIKLPLLIDDDGVLRARFFLGDAENALKTACIDGINEEHKRRYCEYTTKEGLERFLNGEVNE